jgi:uncharacterized protein (TIGR02246 family)
MILTVLDATVPEHSAHLLRGAFDAAGAKPVPPGLVRTELVRDARDPQHWRIETHWATREALEAMRGAGTPAGVLMFRSAGVEPTLTVLELAASLPSRSSGDAAEVAGVVQGFARAWNAHDMAAFAELFADDAHFVNVVGLWWQGRTAIREAHEASHATMFRGSTLEFRGTDVRFLAPEIAVARTRWSLQGHVSPDGARLPERKGLLVNVLSRAAGRWQILDSQNTDIVEGALTRPQ